MNPEVLVVGAGPTGLVLAIWLARLGVHVRMVDEAAEAGTTSRAVVVQARTLELYRQVGLAREVADAGLEFSALDLWARGAKRAPAEFGRMGAGLSPFPYVIDCPQDEHERLLVGTSACELIGLEEAAGPGRAPRSRRSVALRRPVGRRVRRCAFRRPQGARDRFSRRDLCPHLLRGRRGRDGSRDRRRAARLARRERLRRRISARARRPAPHGDDFDALQSLDWQAHVYGASGEALTTACASRGLVLRAFPWGETAATAGVARDATYLVPPDGYVALADRAQSTERLRRSLDRQGLRFVATAPHAAATGAHVQS